MNRIFQLLFILLFFPLNSFCEEFPLHLKDNFSEARVGDYIITKFNKTFTLMAVHAKSKNKISFQEVTIPSHLLPDKGKPPFSWVEWYEEGARNHTSWILYSLNLKSGKLEKQYSLSRKSWMDIDDGNSLFSTLLTLTFEITPKEERKRRGPAPTAGTLDRRTIWHPQMIVNGSKIRGLPFSAWKATWPKDGSELAGKVIEIYLPESHRDYPSYFPYWLEVKGGYGSAKIRVKDSGRNLQLHTIDLPLSFSL